MNSLSPVLTVLLEGVSDILCPSGIIELPSSGTPSLTP